MFFIIVWLTMALIITCLAYPHVWEYLLSDYQVDDDSDTERCFVFFMTLLVNLFVWHVVGLLGAAALIFQNAISPWLPKVLRWMER